MSFMGDISGGAQAFGMLQSIVGSYYQAAAQKGQLRSAAMDAEFASSMANINARAAEREAMAIIQAGRQQSALLSAQYGQAKSSYVARTAASGIRQTGSAAEVRTSMELAKMEDLATLRQNVASAASRAQAGAVDQRNRSLLAGVSARNLRRTAGTIKPWENVLTSLVGSSGSLAQSWRYRGGAGSSGGGQGAMYDPAPLAPNE
jgi:hypothetical protein